MQRSVDWAGGVSSTLALTLEYARASLDGGTRGRSGRTAQEWEPLRRVLASHLPPTSWLSRHSVADEAVKTALNRQLETAMTRARLAAADMHDAWIAGTRAETARRRRFDAAHGIARTVLRAWRELHDNLRAGSAKARQRMAEADIHGHGYQLARRLSFSEDTGSAAAGGQQGDEATPMEGVTTQGRDGTEPYRLLMQLLNYQRLVGYARVMELRRESPTWQAEERARRGAMAYGLAIRSNGAPPTRILEVEQATVAATAPPTPPRGGQGASEPTAGALSVIARRAQNAARDVRVISCPMDRANSEVMRVTVTAARAAGLPMHVATPPRARRRPTNEEWAAPRAGRKRRHDGQLRQDQPQTQELRQRWLLHGLARRGDAG